MLFGFVVGTGNGGIDEKIGVGIAVVGNGAGSGAWKYESPRMWRNVGEVGGTQCLSSSMSRKI